MSEKRFTRVEFSNGIWGVKDNNTEYEYPSPIDLLDLLNELNDENQELKRLINRMGELGGFNKHLIKTICEDLE